MSTINIIALTAVLLSFAAYLFIQPRLKARPTAYGQPIVEEETDAELSQSQVWTVVHQLSPSLSTNNLQSQFVVDSQQVEIALPTDEREQIQAVLQALKQKMNADTSQNQSFWPEVLGVPDVYLSDFGNNQAMVILNFPLTQDVDISIHQEEALRASIVATLEKNNINNNLWLINDELRPFFLRHIALQTDLQ